MFASAQFPRFLPYPSPFSHQLDVTVRQPVHSQAQQLEPPRTGSHTPPDASKPVTYGSAATAYAVPISVDFRLEVFEVFEGSPGQAGLPLSSFYASYSKS